MSAGTGVTGFGASRFPDRPRLVLIITLFLLLHGLSPALAQGLPPDESAVSAEPSAQSVTLLPKAVGEWRLAPEPQEFSAADLWKEIDGAAEQYLSYGCTRLTAGYYRLPVGDSEIAAEIYALRDDLGSFGLYALERPAKGPRLAIGTEGYQAAGDLNFFCGSHYVKLRAFPDGSAEQEAARRIAQAIARDHLSGCTYPRELDLFPREKLISDSFGFLPEGVFGLGGVERLLTARYRDTAGEMTLGVARNADEAAAAEALAVLCEALGKRSLAALRDTVVAAHAGVRGELKHHGPVVVVRQGADIMLAAGAVDELWATPILVRVLENLALSQGSGKN